MWVRIECLRNGLTESPMGRIVIKHFCVVSQADNDLPLRGEETPDSFEYSSLNCRRETWIWRISFKTKSWWVSLLLFRLGRGGSVLVKNCFFKILTRPTLAELQFYLWNTRGVAIINFAFTYLVYQIIQLPFSVLGLSLSFKLKNLCLSYNA